MALPEVYRSVDAPLELSDYGVEDTAGTLRSSLRQEAIRLDEGLDNDSGSSVPTIRELFATRFVEWCRRSPYN